MREQSRCVDETWGRSRQRLGLKQWKRNSTNHTEHWTRKKKKAEGAISPVRTDSTTGLSPPGEVLLLGSDGQCLS